MLKVRLKSKILKQFLSDLDTIWGHFISLKSSLRGVYADNVPPLEKTSCKNNPGSLFSVA